MLFTYLKERPMDVSGIHYELAGWRGWNEALEGVGSSEAEIEAFLDQDRHEDAYEVFYKLDDWLNQNPRAKESAVEYMMCEEPASAPTWSHLDLSVKRLLPATTWLVHWTNDASGIAVEGFKHGVSDLTRLGLTNHTSKHEKKYGGYNFAFQASSRYSTNPDFRYGSEFVIFQSGGVEAYHSGDSESQVIFWGASITTKPVPVSRNDDGKWVVGLYKELAKLDSQDDAMSWVIKNYAQYRRHL